MLRKSDPARMNTVLYVTIECVRQAAILAQPVIPDGASALLNQLAVGTSARDFSRLGTAGRLVPQTALPKPQGVFPRFVDDETES